MEYASKGVAGAALGTGIGGLALGLLNGNGGNLLGGILGGGGYNRYDAEKDAEIATLKTEVHLRDANTFTMGEMGKLRDYFDHKFDHVERELCDQKVYNATNNAVLGCIKNQVDQLYGLSKLVVPNGSICPGWGDVTVSVAPATTTTTAG